MTIYLTYSDRRGAGGPAVTIVFWWLCIGEGKFSRVVVGHACCFFMRSDAVSDVVCFKAGNACFSSEHAAISFCDLAGHYS